MNHIMTINNDAPIGIFDSGLGGLTVLQNIRKVLPNENYIYFGDTAHLPYGSKSNQNIIEYSKYNTVNTILSNGKYQNVFSSFTITYFCKLYGCRPNVIQKDGVINFFCFWSF